MYDSLRSVLLFLRAKFSPSFEQIMKVYILQFDKIFLQVFNTYFVICSESDNSHESFVSLIILSLFLFLFVAIARETGHTLF